MTCCTAPDQVFRFMQARYAGRFVLGSGQSV